jgi:hypothetical protein
LGKKTDGFTLWVRLVWRFSSTGGSGTSEPTQVCSDSRGKGKTYRLNFPTNSPPLTVQP